MIRNLLTQLGLGRSAPNDPEFPVSFAALLVQIARADGRYSQDEMDNIDRILVRHQGIGPFEAAELRRKAEILESESSDSVRFTRSIKKAIPIEQRSAVMEALWAIALTDGQRDPEENSFMRMATGLLGLTDVQNAEARQRAERIKE